MVFEIKLQTKPSNPQWAGELLDSFAFLMWFFGLALFILVFFLFLIILQNEILAVEYTLATYIWLGIPFIIFTIGSKDLKPMCFEDYNSYIQYKSDINVMKEVKRIWSNI